MKYSYSLFLYNLRGSANALLKRFDAAVECYKNAIRVDPNYAAIYNNLGNVFKEKGEILLLKFAQALEDYGVVEQMPKLEGKRMTMFIAPKKKK